MPSANLITRRHGALPAACLPLIRCLGWAPRPPVFHFSLLDAISFQAPRTDLTGCPPPLHCSPYPRPPGVRAAQELLGCLKVC